MQRHAAPVADRQEGNVHLVPHRLPAVILAAVEAVSHVLPDPIFGKSVWIVFIGLAKNMVGHMVHIPVADKAKTEDSAVEGEIAIHVGGAFPRNDCLQRGWLEVGDKPLRHRKIRNAQQSDLAVTPGLARRPFDGVVEVERLLN
jgi:hypothetical protein